METAADDSKLNLEQGRASEFAPSSTMKPFAAAVDGNANSHQRSTTNSKATSKDAAAVAPLSSGVASSITNSSGGLKRGQISLYFDLGGLASQDLVEDFDLAGAFDAVPSTLANANACNTHELIPAPVMPLPGRAVDGTGMAELDVSSSSGAALVAFNPKNFTADFKLALTKELEWLTAQGIIILSRRRRYDSNVDGGYLTKVVLVLAQFCGGYSVCGAGGAGGATEELLPSPAHATRRYSRR